MIGRIADRAAPAFGRLALTPPPPSLAAGTEASARGQRGRIGPAGGPLQCGPHIAVKKNKGRALWVVPVVPSFQRSFGNSKSLVFRVSSRCSRCSRSILNSTRVRDAHTRRRIV